MLIAGIFSLIMDTEMDTLRANRTQAVEYMLTFFDKDNLVDQWVLTSTPYPVTILLFLYFLFVLKIGPSFMENRRPYNLNTVMRVYNICQVLANFRLMFYPLVTYVGNLPYVAQLSCDIPKETDDNIDELRLAFMNLFHGYLVIKMVDLLDTVFMVLRKKNSHITFLHVYHHGIMVFGTWYTIKYFKSVQVVLPGLINVIVHMVMYSYFFLATFGEPVRKYLWWKKYLTKLQLAQFVVILIYFFTLNSYGCPISEAFTYFWLFNVFLILCLFINFYMTAYVKKPINKKIEKKTSKQD